jgi:hypothetical protein
LEEKYEMEMDEHQKKLRKDDFEQLLNGWDEKEKCNIQLKSH